MFKKVFNSHAFRSAMFYTTYLGVSAYMLEVWRRRWQDLKNILTE